MDQVLGEDQRAVDGNVEDAILAANQLRLDAEALLE